jgi:hypothetical protein
MESPLLDTSLIGSAGHCLIQVFPISPMSVIMTPAIPMILSPWKLTETSEFLGMGKPITDWLWYGIRLISCYGIAVIGLAGYLTESGIVIDQSLTIFVGIKVSSSLV